jgi:hypothetical protein
VTPVIARCGCPFACHNSGSIGTIKPQCLVLFLYATTMSTLHAVWILSACIVLISFLFRAIKNRSSWIKFAPGPRPIPVIGNILQLPSEKQEEVYAEWAKQYGSLSLISLGRSQTLVSRRYHPCSCSGAPYCSPQQFTSSSRFARKQGFNIFRPTTLRAALGDVCLTPSSMRTEFVNSY